MAVLLRRPFGEDVCPDVAQGPKAYPMADDLRVEALARAIWDVERRFDPPDPMPGFLVPHGGGEALPWDEQREPIRAWCRRRAAVLLESLDGPEGEDG